MSKKRRKQSDLSSEMSVALEEFRQLYFRYRQHASPTDILSSLEGEEYFPTSIFSPELSSLEAITKHLRENCGLRNGQIADMLGRSKKTTSQAYANAQKKHISALPAVQTPFSIPLAIFSDRTTSVLGHIVVWLRDTYSLKYSEIAHLLHRDHQTIWSTYQHAKTTSRGVTKADVTSESLVLPGQLHDLRSAYIRLTKYISSGALLQLLERSVPASIFRTELTVLESIVKYLRDIVGLRNNDVAVLLHRSARSISQAYGLTKHTSFIAASSTPPIIPLSIFTNTVLSAQENVVVYLHDSKKLRFSDIAVILHRSPKTVWTAYNRAQEKGDRSE